MNIKDKAVKKSIQSNCNYKVSALGFSRKGDFIGAETNKHRFPGKGRGMHAEHLLICRYGKKIKTIVICRTGRSGNILPIDPCDKCKKLADSLNIKIISIKD